MCLCVRLSEAVFSRLRFCLYRLILVLIISGTQEIPLYSGFCSNAQSVRASQGGYFQRFNKLIIIRCSLFV